MRVLGEIDNIVIFSLFVRVIKKIMLVSLSQKVKKISRVQIIGFFFLFSVGLFAQPKQEMRAVWLTTVYNIDWPSSMVSAAQQQSEMCEILDSLKSANFNTIMFQVRARGDLLYPSVIEPWGRSVSGSLGQNPGYNVLQFIIDEAHKRGIEIHAWIVTYKVYDNQSQPPVTTPLHVVRNHPEWCKLYNDNGNYAWWLDPGIPQVKDYLTSIVMEIVRNYNVDGIHFDYIRYPDADFDDAATYAAYGNGQNLADWRRNNINQFVSQVYDSIASVKPDIKLGSAPIGIYKNLLNASGWQGYSEIFQDSRSWLAARKHDYICPQIYWDIANPPSDPSFPVLVTDWVSNAAFRHVYPGIAAYRMNAKEKSIENNSRHIKTAKNNWPASEILHEIDTTRALGGLGQIYFSNNDICGNTKNIFTLLKSGQYHYPANIPSMNWKDSIPSYVAQNLIITCLDSLNYLLSWNPPMPASDGDTVKYYNVYRDLSSPVDISDIKKVTGFQIMKSLSSLVAFDVPPVVPVNFTVTSYDNGYNESPPASEVNTGACKFNSIVANNWQSQDFNVLFADSAFLHVRKRFYQVLDFNGTEWRTNKNYGFFNDNFTTALSTEWHTVSGNWDTISAHLQQMNLTETNSNMYAMLNQNNFGTTLYQWRMNISGTGSNRRAGFHFFCDDPTQSNRNNSYLVYFRADNNKVQIYKYTANNMFIATDDVCPITTNTWYDCKITFDPQSGKIEVFLNNHLVTSWVDPIPFISGNSISLRTGECTAMFDDIRVFKSRSIQENIHIGDTAKEVRFQNNNPTSPSCRIQSFTTTPEGYFSAMAVRDINIDWTPPIAFQVYDENIAELDTLTTSSVLNAIWTLSSDTNSGIIKYLFAIGTTPGDSDVFAWMDNNLDTIVHAENLNLVNGQLYYCSVKAVNAAGLSTISVSDGVRVILTPLAAFSISDTVICEGNLVSFANISENADLYQWTFEGGYPSVSTQLNPIVLYDTAGVFSVELEVEGPGGYDTLVKQGYVHVKTKPQTSFFVNDTLLMLPGAYATFTNLTSNANSYIWDFGDGFTSTDENPWHQYISEGEFTVTLIAYNDLCGADTLVLYDYVHVANPNIIAGNTSNIFINVIPNPINEKSVIYFEIKSASSVSISFSDVLGKEIILQEKKIFEQGIHIVSLNSIYPQFSEGIYFIKLTSNSKTSVIKITK